jgi:hypothetical protein
MFCFYFILKVVELISCVEVYCLVQLLLISAKKLQNKLYQTEP